MQKIPFLISSPNYRTLPRETINVNRSFGSKHVYYWTEMSWNAENWEDIEERLDFKNILKNELRAC